MARQTVDALDLRESNDGQMWVAVTPDTLSYERAADWVTLPDCGAVTVFGGTVRDHADGRPGVTELEYEAYGEQVIRRLRDIAVEARRRWDGIGRVLLWHRVGVLGVGECSVIVAVSSAHRAESFEAARFCIDTLKRTVPIWKRERWEGGEDWGTDAKPIETIGGAEGEVAR